MTQELATVGSKVIAAQFDFNLASKWLSYAQVSAASVKAYKKGISRLQEYFSAKKVTIPTREDFVLYREYLGGKYQATTANLYLTAAKLFFGFLTVEGVIAVNPAEHLKGFKVSNTHKKNALSVDQTRAIVKNIDTSSLKGLRDKALYALMTTCGLRCIEVVRANVSDIEQIQGVYRLRVQGKGKTQKDNAVNIPANVYNLIVEYLARRGKVTDSSPLFASASRRNYGGRLTTTSISRIIKGCLRAAGFDSPRLTAHSLRHSAATVALKSGASIREVQQLLRHTQIGTTTIYLHELSALENPASSLAAAFGF